MSARDELAALIGAKLDGIFGTRDFGPATQDYTLADELIASGYSKPRMVTEVVGVNVLPHESVILTKQGYAMEKLSDGWYRAGVDCAYTPNPLWLPATVLHDPSAA